MIDEPKTGLAWNALRATLQGNFTFYQIKEIVGLAGLDLSFIAHLEQKAGGGASKGRLLTNIDKGYHVLEGDAQKHFIAVVSEEALKRKPDLRQDLEQNLLRLGWCLDGTSIVPIEVLDPFVFDELPPPSRLDLAKAAQRLRDSDLSGAVSSACGALDATTSAIYASNELGDPHSASFQERYNRALKARGFLSEMERQLLEIGWEGADVRTFCENVKGALNHSAYVLQTLRSKMGDVHGTKPILKPLVFDCVKWAELMLRTLSED